MECRFIEATNGPNWGKFLLQRFTKEEFAYCSKIDLGHSLLRIRGWSMEQIIVTDLETTEGAGFYPGGNAHADLEKHNIWVCPLFEPFLKWLYQQYKLNPDITKFFPTLPALVELPKAAFELYGYRRQGRKKDGAK